MGAFLLVDAITEVSLSSWTIASCAATPTRRWP